MPIEANATEEKWPRKKKETFNDSKTARRAHGRASCNMQFFATRGLDIFYFSRSKSVCLPFIEILFRSVDLCEKKVKISGVIWKIRSSRDFILCSTLKFVEQ